MRVGPLAVVCVVLGIATGVGATVVELGGSPFGLPESEDTVELLLGRLDQPAPRVIVDEPDFDFGVLQRLATASHDFVVRNAGDAPLVLKELRTTCKCTLGKVGGGAIGPGESSVVTLDWSVKTNEAFFRQSATIETNDPRRPVITLTVAGKVSDAIVASPNRLSFDGLGADSTKTLSFKLYSMESADFSIEKMDLTNPETKDFFEVRSEPLPTDRLKEGAKGGFEIFVTAKPGLPLEAIRQSLRVRTNLTENRVVEIPFEGTVASDISVTFGAGWNAKTNVLSLGGDGVVSSKDGYKTQVTVTVRGSDHRNVKFEVTEVVPSFVKVRIGEAKHTEQKTVIPVEVEVPPGSPLVDHSGTQHGERGVVRIATGHSKAPELRLSLQFVVSD